MPNYATIAEAQTYFDSRLNTEPWDNETDVNIRTKALGHATNIIDRLNYSGCKADEAQVNQFPRGTDVTIPQDIKNASSEIALALLDGVDPQLEFENVFMTSQGYGGVRSSFDRTVKPAHLLAGVPSFTAWTYLHPYLSDPLNIELHRTS
jgi:hypothetical protein